MSIISAGGGERDAGARALLTAEGGEAGRVAPLEQALIA